ncbi:hypothetical protein DS909_07880 [Phaeobacter gallaeciensis]|uniref:Uncharacterized protein n=1 Tax=Phaeobacter gallaeciensis TaxID=60890 RepID=A0A366X1T8_9RHOB|nr:hypothetical protein DS909_07880 [Phaeobacter gallaeciensis]
MDLGSKYVPATERVWRNPDAAMQRSAPRADCRHSPQVREQMLRFPKAAIQNSKLLGVHAAPRIKVSNAQIVQFAKSGAAPGTALWTNAQRMAAPTIAGQW